MKFVRTQQPQNISVTTSERFTYVDEVKGTYRNDSGNLTHHPRGKNSANIEKAPPTKVKFVGVDGEGMAVNGHHRYVLFGVGEQQIEDSTGLRWSDCFDLLYSNHRDNRSRNTAYCGFFLGYDFSQIFRTLPEERARMLLTKEGRLKRQHQRPRLPPHPVEYDGWQFDILGMKRLRIRPKNCDCEFASCKCPDKASWMYVCDVGSFFQSSFLKVIDPKGWAEGTEIVTPEEWTLIKAGKEARSTAVLDEEMRMYNRLENVVLSRVMDTLDTGFRNIGILLPPAKWFGPGQAAQTWLKNESVPTRDDMGAVIPMRYNEAARASYYGGWFEIMMHGIIPGTSYEYDINSAYPSIIAKLPCLLHGEYSSGEGLPPNNPKALTLVYAAVQSPCHNESSKWNKQHIGAMLHRDDHGNISRPMNTEGWYWWDELQAAERAGLIKKLDNVIRVKKKERFTQEVKKWVQYIPCNCPPPMANIAGLYMKRLEVGKTSPLGKAAKLAYNSAYGKFAQSEGLNPVYGSAIYASRITSGCRTEILNAIATHPYGKADVAMVATDAVYFLHPHPSLPLSESLGEWDFKEKQNLTLFKPGVYWDNGTRKRIANGENPNFKARGFKASDFTSALRRVDAEFARWDSYSSDAIAKINRANAALPMIGVQAKAAWPWPKVKFTPSFVMTTALQALQRNKWETAGEVKGTKEMEELGKELTQDSDPYKKRQRILREEYHGRQIYRSIPVTHTFEASKPYDKHFGMEDPFSDDYRAQFGETQQGRVMDVLAWILNGD